MNFFKKIFSKLYSIVRNYFTIIILSISVIIYTYFISSWAIYRVMNFEATMWDLGIMLQTIWNTSQGRLFQESINLGFNISRLSVAHWEFIYLPIAIIFRFIPNMNILLYLQTATLAIGVFPIYYYALKKTTSKLIGLMIALSYLLYPPLHGCNLFDIHGITFSTSLLLIAFYFLYQNNFKNTILFSLLCLSCREDVAIITLMMGFYSLIIKQNKKLGTTLIILSIFWLTAFLSREFYISQPELLKNTQISSNWNHIFNNGFFTIIENTIGSIKYLINSLITNVNLKLLVKLLLPVLGLSILSPSILFIALPVLLMNMLSDWPHAHQIEYHYTATITPFIFLAAISSLAKIQNWTCNLKHHSKLVKGIAIIIFICSIFSTFTYSILRYHINKKPTQKNINLTNRLQKIQENLSVSSTARLAPFLTKRKELYHFPANANKVNIILIELNRPVIEIKNMNSKFPTSKVPTMNELVETTLQNKNLGLNFVEDNVFCLKRGIDPINSFTKYSFRNKLPENGVMLQNVNINNELVFLGWETVYIGRQQAHFKLFWKKINFKEEKQRISFHLFSGDTINEIAYKPIFGRVELNEWPIDKVICDHLFINKQENNINNSVYVSISTSQNNENSKHHLFNFEFKK